MADYHAALSLRPVAVRAGQFLGLWVFITVASVAGTWVSGAHVLPVISIDTTTGLLAHLFVIQAPASWLPAGILVAFWAVYSGGDA